MVNSLPESKLRFCDFTILECHDDLRSQAKANAALSCLKNITEKLMNERVNTTGLSLGKYICGCLETPTRFQTIMVKIIWAF